MEKYVKEPIEVFQEINKSKFITYLFEANNEDMARNHLSMVKKNHPKATHHCSAMVIGDINRSNDDGEPASTAGLPMLQTLLGNQVQNVLAVVVRYFGGTLLGKGGLIRAYSSSVTQALHTGPLYVKKVFPIYSIQCPFDLLNIIESQSEPRATIIDRHYEKDATYQLRVFDESLIQDFQSSYGHLFTIQQIDQETFFVPWSKDQ